MNEMATIMMGLGGDAGQEFRPCAFFDDRLDCIRVITRDCSVVEERITDRITVLMDMYHPRNDSEAKRYVGFTIKGARHFCKEQGLSPHALRLTELLDAVLRTSPECVAQLFVEHIARPLVEEESLDHVDVQDAAVAPA